MNKGRLIRKKECIREGNSEMLGKTQIIDINSSIYPPRLKEIPNPPLQLYCNGDLGLLGSDSVAVVGSRKFTVYGKYVAKMIGGRLAECGIPVVSGLAYGIDAFSHEGALDAGGRIIGVLASGILKMGPRKNLDLMKRGLATGGLIVTEYPPDADACKGTFPARNRIISGLSKCLVVVEANFNSGSLITAQHAAAQGRPVYAVPGNINSQFSMGSNLLIRDGAYPLVVIDDLIRELGVEPADTFTADPALGDDERIILEAVSRNNGSRPEVIAAATGKTIALVSAVATILEVKGAVETYGGKIYLAK